MKRLKLFATLRDLAGAKEIFVPFDHGQSARELIEAIKVVNPALGSQILDSAGNMTGVVHILVEGRNIEWLKGLDTMIREKDEVILIPPVAGG